MIVTAEKINKPCPLNGKCMTKSLGYTAERERS